MMDDTQPTQNIWPHILQTFAQALGFKVNRKKDSVDAHNQQESDQLGESGASPAPTPEQHSDAAGAMHPKMRALYSKLNDVNKDEKDDDEEQFS